MAGAFALAAVLLAAPALKPTPADEVFAELGLPAPPGVAGLAPEYAADEVDAAEVRKNPKLHPFRAAVLDAADRLKDARAFRYHADLKPVRGRHPFGPTFDRLPPFPNCTGDSKGQISDGSLMVPNLHQALRERVAIQTADLADAAAVLRKVEHLIDKERSLRWKAHHEFLAAEVGYRTVRHNDFNFALGNHFAPPDNEDKNAVWQLNTREEPRYGRGRQRYRDLVPVLLKVEEDHAGGPWAKLARNLLETPPGFTWDIIPEK